jgi:hypothetical protein
MIEHGASKPHEHEVVGHGGHDGGPSMGIEVGTVGWENDQVISELNTDPDDGITLIRVQLFRGRQATKPVTPGIAQGIKILAQLSGPLWNVPARSQRVFVAVPHGMESTPGAAVIMAMPGRAPNTQYGVTKTKMDLGPEQDLVIKAKSITLTTYNNQFVSIVNGQGDNDGIYIQDKDGSGVIVQNGNVYVNTVKSVIQLSDSECHIVVANGSANTCCVKMDYTGCAVTGVSFYANTGTVYLGYMPTAGPVPSVGNAAVIAGACSTATTTFSLVDSVGAACKGYDLVHSTPGAPAVLSSKVFIAS